MAPWANASAPTSSRGLEALLGDQRPGNRSAQQVHALVLGLPLEHGEGEIAAQLLLGVDDPGRAGADAPGLVEDRLPVLARLAQVHVHAVDVVPLFHQPTQDDRSIQPARIRENTAWHRSAFLRKEIARSEATF